MFQVPPDDRESDSALAESLSGNTLADQSSLPRWMLLVLVRYITSPQSHLCLAHVRNHCLGQHSNNSFYGVRLGGLFAGAQSGVPGYFTALLSPSSLGNGVAATQCLCKMLTVVENSLAEDKEAAIWLACARR